MASSHQGRLRRLRARTLLAAPLSRQWKPGWRVAGSTDGWVLGRQVLEIVFAHCVKVGGLDARNGESRGYYVSFCQEPLWVISNGIMLKGRYP